MTELDLTSVYTTIGGVLGTPAAIAFFYLWNKVKELEKRLNEGNHPNVCRLVLLGVEHGRDCN